MASSPLPPPGRWKVIFFALRGLYCEEPWCACVCARAWVCGIWRENAVFSVKRWNWNCSSLWQLLPRFCASIALAFILGVKLFDYVLDGRGGESAGAWLEGREAKWRTWHQDGGNQTIRTYWHRSHKYQFTNFGKLWTVGPFFLRIWLRWYYLTLLWLIIRRV